MGKANRPLVVRIRPGEARKDAIARVLAGPNAHKRNPSKIILRTVSK